MSKHITITGIDETVKKLWLYSEAFEKSAKALTKKASKEVESEYKSRAPVGKTGNLKRSIKAKNIFNRSEGPAATVMPRATKQGKGYHRHWVAYGTKSRKQNTTGRGTGVMPSNPFAEGVGQAAGTAYEAALSAEASKHVVI